MFRWFGWMTLGAVLVLGSLPSVAWSEEKFDPSRFDPAVVDPFMGNYEGTFEIWGWGPTRAEAKVVPESEEDYRVMVAVESGPGDLWGIRGELSGKRKDGEVTISGTSGGIEWEGTIEDGLLKAQFKGSYGGSFQLRHVPRDSPNAGAPAPKGAVVLLPYSPGKAPDLSEWVNQDWTALPDGTMQVGKGSQISKREFGDHRIHLEFATPHEPTLRGQGRGNSGLYVHSRYEAQILESFGLIQRGGDVGSFYLTAVPRVNAALPPLYWQTYDITLRTARFNEDGSVKELPWITVVLNGVTIYDKLPLEGPTAGGAEGAAKKAPILLQDHGNKVRFRNIWVVEEAIP